ncbi:leucyl aminopeptidase, partial [Thioclava sp. BHET1]
MTPPDQIQFQAADVEVIKEFSGRVVVFAAPEGKLNPLARRVDRLSRGALSRALASEAFGKLAEGDALEIAFPAGLAAEAVQVIKLAARPAAAIARKAGAAIGRSRGKAGLLVLAGGQARAAEISFGLALRDYSFTDHKSEAQPERGAVLFQV